MGEVAPDVGPDDPPGASAGPRRGRRRVGRPSMVEQLLAPAAAVAQLPQPPGPGAGHPGRAPHAPLRGQHALAGRGVRVAARAPPLDRAGRPGGHGRGAAGRGHGAEPVPAAGRLRPGGRRAGRRRRRCSPTRGGWTTPPPTTAPRRRSRTTTSPRAAGGRSARATTGSPGTAGSPPATASPEPSGGWGSARTPRPRPPCSGTPTRTRPWVIGVHGFCMGFPFMDFPGLHAGRIHHELGHERGPAGAAAPRVASGHPGERRAVPLVRAHERRARPDPGGVGPPAAHQLDPVPGCHVDQPVRRVARAATRWRCWPASSTGSTGWWPVSRWSTSPGCSTAHSPRHIRVRAIEHRIMGGTAENVYRVVSPLCFDPLVAPRPALHLRRLRRPAGHPRPGPTAGRALGRTRRVAGTPGTTSATCGPARSPSSSRRRWPRPAASSLPRTQPPDRGTADRGDRCPDSTPSSSTPRPRPPTCTPSRSPCPTCRDLEGGFSFATMTEVLGQLLVRLPPFRRRVVPVPLGLGHPVWVEDPDFDLRPARQPGRRSTGPVTTGRWPPPSADFAGTAAPPRPPPVGHPGRRGARRRPDRRGGQAPPRRGRRRRPRWRCCKNVVEAATVAPDPAAAGRPVGPRAAARRAATRGPAPSPSSVARVRGLPHLVAGVGPSARASERKRHASSRCRRSPSTTSPGRRSTCRSTRRAPSP